MARNANSIAVLPVVRNIGGRAGRAITDIVGLDAFFGVASVCIIHHTDCGMTHMDDHGLQEVLKKRHPESKEEIEKWHFGEIKE